MSEETDIKIPTGPGKRVRVQIWEDGDVHITDEYMSDQAWGRVTWDESATILLDAKHKAAFMAAMVGRDHSYDVADEDLAATYGHAYRTAARDGAEHPACHLAGLRAIFALGMGGE